MPVVLHLSPKPPVSDVLGWHPMSYKSDDAYGDYKSVAVMRKDHSNYHVVLGYTFGGVWSLDYPTKDDDKELVALAWHDGKSPVNMEAVMAALNMMTEDGPDTDDPEGLYLLFADRLKSLAGEKF